MCQLWVWLKYKFKISSQAGIWLDANFKKESNPTLIMRSRPYIYWKEEKEG